MESENCLPRLTCRQRLILEKLNSADFEKAIRERNFNEMSDIYNEMMHHETTERLDKYIFTEILDGYIIKLPIIAKSVIHSIGKDFYYVLKDNYIMYDKYRVINENHTTNIILDYLKYINMEADKVELVGDTITFTPMAIQTLKLSVGDIIEIILTDNESFELSKFERPLAFE